MNVKCYSVSLAGLVSISDKACKVIDYSGGTAVIPKSQIYGYDIDSMKSESWWISEWILEKVAIQYSRKKVAWFDKDSRRMRDIMVVKHVPKKVAPVENYIEELKK